MPFIIMHIVNSWLVTSSSCISNKQHQSTGTSSTLVSSFTYVNLDEGAVRECHDRSVQLYRLLCLGVHDKYPEGRRITPEALARYRSESCCLARSTQPDVLISAALKRLSRGLTLRPHDACCMSLEVPGYGRWLSSCLQVTCKRLESRSQIEIRVCIAPRARKTCDAQLFIR
jgi:hypothetical protein